MPSNNFKRIEKKFWMTPSQYHQLITQIADRIVLDGNGTSTICNIYYDTDSYSLIRKSIERPFFKEKIRVRSYGIPSKETKVFIELKRKHDGIGYKRRIQMTFDQAMHFMMQQQQPSNQIEAEIFEFLNRYPVRPKVILTYHRSPYYLIEDHDFRITFDSDLKYKFYQESMTLDEKGKNIMNHPENILLEIKTGKAIPCWLLEILNNLQIYQAPFSKIGTVYTKHIQEVNHD